MISTIDELPIDTVQVNMNGETFYYSRNWDQCFMKVTVVPKPASALYSRLFKHDAYKEVATNFHIRQVKELRERQSKAHEEERKTNEDWRDKYNVLWDKYIMYKDECKALKEQLNKIQDPQKENEPNSK